MKKLLTLALAAIMILSVMILPVSAAETDETVEKMDLKKYMISLPWYFYDTYKMGEEIEWKGVLGVFELYCWDNADSLDFVRVEDPEVAKWVYLEGKGFREFSKVLFGDSFDPDMYLGEEMKYDAETDTYSYSMATDYWGQNTHYDGKNVRITEGEEHTTARVDIYIGNELEENPTFVGTYDYKFNHVEYKGMIYYQLDEITLVSDKAPQTGVASVALAIMALVSGGYVVSRKRK